MEASHSFCRRISFLVASQRRGGDTEFIFLCVLAALCPFAARNPLLYTSRSFFLLLVEKAGFAGVDCDFAAAGILRDCGGEVHWDIWARQTKFVNFLQR